MLKTPKQLIEYLQLPQTLLPELEAASQGFPIRATDYYLSNIKKGDLTDPLLKQILPVSAELDSVAGFVSDALNEKEYSLGNGVIRKYKSRVLVVTNGSCAIHCRYCFRRHFPYQEQKFSSKQQDELIEFLSQSPEINEVILSGGDPLMHPVKVLRGLVKKISQVDTIKRLRIHSRIPVVMPARLDREFTDWWNAIRLQKIMVVHANHAQELGDEVESGLRKLEGTTLLNQSVLLKGINDQSDTLNNLSERLFEIGALPYYLHLLDKVSGVAHFDVSVEDALGLVAQMQKDLPGFLVPKLVREEPGVPHKTLVR